MKMVNDGDLWACTDDTVRFQFERTATSFSPKRAYHFFQALRISLVILREDVGVRKMQQYQRTKFQEETASCLGLGLLNLFVCFTGDVWNGSDGSYRLNALASPPWFSAWLLCFSYWNECIKNIYPFIMFLFSWFLRNFSCFIITSPQFHIL